MMSPLSVLAAFRDSFLPRVLYIAMALVRKSSFSESESESFLNSESFFEPGMLRLVELFEMVRTAAVPAGCRAPRRRPKCGAPQCAAAASDRPLRLAVALCLHRHRAYAPGGGTLDQKLYIAYNIASFIIAMHSAQHP